MYKKIDDFCFNALCEIFQYINYLLKLGRYRNFMIHATETHSKTTKDNGYDYSLESYVAMTRQM